MPGYKKDLLKVLHMTVKHAKWAHPKMKPAPKMRIMPGSSRDTLAVYMARKMAQPAQLF